MILNLEDGKSQSIMQLDVFLLILRLLLVVLLYLFLMQVVLVIWRGLGKTSEDKVGPESSAPKVYGQLIVIDPGPTPLPRGTPFPLGPRNTIGRAFTCTIQIPDQGISTEHARLWYQNNTWYVEDAGSRNGTYVNKQPVRGVQPVRVGDIIHVGYVGFELAQ
jgi:hypothetical protein